MGKYDLRTTEGKRRAAAADERGGFYFTLATLIGYAVSVWLGFNDASFWTIKYADFEWWGWVLWGILTLYAASGVFLIVFDESYRNMAGGTIVLIGIGYGIYLYNQEGSFVQNLFAIFD